MSNDVANGLNIVISRADKLCQIGPISADNPALGYLNAGDGLYSPARAIRLFGQDDGNFVLQYVQAYDLPFLSPDYNWSNQPLPDPNGRLHPPTWVTYWQTGTAYNEVGDVGPTNRNNIFVMQPDGNCVVYDLNKPGDAAVWASNTAGNPGAFLRLQDDGNMFITNQQGQVVWQSATSCIQSRGANV